MNPLKLTRVIIFSLIAGVLLFLRPDQIRDPSLYKNPGYSFVPGARDKQNIDRTTRARVEQTYGKLPMRFEANEGQTNARVKFIARGAGYSVFLTGDEAVLRLRRREGDSERTAERRMAEMPVESVVLRMKLDGSNQSSRVSGIEKLPTTSNYFTGNNPAAWRRGVSNYSKVKYESIYPGIDLVWYGNQQTLEHDFMIAPGADPSRIKLSFSGADKMSIDGDGALVTQAGGEELRLLKPRAWQGSNGARRAITCDYRLGEKDQVEFLLGPYDTTLPLVIDPVLVYSTYIGGVGTDTGLDIAVDGEGAAYISGQTDSSDFPGPSPIQPARGTQTDAFVLKINPEGNAVVFGTWIGGNGFDSASTVSVDLSGNVYLAGSTSSLNFPLRNPLQSSRSGPSDAFAVKIDSSGSALIYSTYIGGTGADRANALAVDDAGSVYLTGDTDSGDFPVVNAFQSVKNGSGAYASDNGGASWGEIGNGLIGADVNDLAIFPGASSTIFAGTDRGVFKSVDRGASWNLLGGTQFIRNISQVLVDPTTPDILYAVSASQLFKSIDGGATWVPKPILIVRTIAMNPATPSTLYAGALNGFQISANGGDSWTPVFIPPVIGGSLRQIVAIAVDPTTPATIYVGSEQGIYKSVNGGATWTFAGSGLPIFSGQIMNRIAISRSSPATLYALTNNGTIFKSINAGGSWAQPNGQPIGPQFSQLPLPLVVAPDNPEVVYVGSQNSGIFRSNDGGATWNTVNNGLNARNIRAIVIDPNAPERVYAGVDSGTEAFIAKLDTTASSFIYSSYLGGSASESGASIVVDSTGAAYVAGSTNSANLPVVNAFQETLAGPGDAFVAKVNETGSALSWATYLGGSNSDNATGIAMSATGEIFVAGGTLSSDFPVMNAIQPSLKGLQDGFITRLKNDGSGLDFSTYLGGAGFDSVAAIAVDSAGAPYVTGVTDSLDFPVASAVQSTRGGNPTFSDNDAFVTKLSADGAAIIYSTYLGGASLDQGLGIAVDASTNAYVTGMTFSNDFPTTPFPIRTAGFSDSFVAKLGLSADLTITLTGAPNPVMINNQITYTLTVTNNGPDPAINARVIDTLPEGVSLVSASPSQGGCSGVSQINCELGNLAPGGGATITIVVTPPNTGTIVNGAGVMSGTPDVKPANNTATLQTNVSLSPSIYGRVATGDGAGLSGVTVAMNGAVRPPIVTTGSGDYQFAELALGGSYTVTPSRQGYVFNPPNRAFNNLQADQRADFGAVACVFSISPSSQSFPATGGVGSVTLTSPDTQCPWTASSNAPWIKFISPASGNGGAVVRFSVEPTVGSRNATIEIGGNRFKVFQEFNACDSVSFNATPRIELPFDDYGGLILVNDFNQDSRLDLVAVKPGIGARQLLFFPGASDGRFGSPVNALSLPNGQGSFSDLATGDFNNDGALDIAAVADDGFTTWSMWVVLNNGAGGFAPPLTINIMERPRSVTTGDFNSDGKTDLVIAVSAQPNEGQIDALLFLNDGNGGFGQPREIRPDPSFSFFFPNKVKSVDIDSDGKLDLVFFGFGSTVTIYKGDGAGGFTFQPVPDPNLGFSPANAIGDFNGDSHPDLLFVMSGAGGDEINVLLNDGTGRFGPRVITPTGQSVLSTQGAIADDFDGDGKTDVVIRTANQNDSRDTGIRLFTATTGGRFSEPIIYQPSVVAGAMATGDFNRDGLPDILSMNNIGWLTIVSAQGGGFNAPRGFDVSPPSIFSSQFNVSDMKSGDINGDGAPDLVTAAFGLSNAVIRFGNGRGEFGAPVSIDSGVAGGAPSAIELRDFNNDGKPDLALLNSNTRNVAVLLGDGRGGFTPSATISVGVAARGLASADFNNDGNLDIVVRGESNGLALYLGNGQGGFTQSATGIGGNVVNILFTTGDFNGDGMADLATYDETQSSTGDGFNIVVLTGDGQGGFGQPINVKSQNRLGIISAADLNFDGRDDLFYSQGFSGNAVVVTLSNPGGGFGTPVSYQVARDLQSVVSTDVNGDGKLDLISGSLDLGTISILLGKGDGSFNQSVNLPVFNNPTRITAGDFDEDGRIDLVIGRSSIISVLNNKSLCAPEGSVVPVSAASKFRYRVARNSIVTLQGENLAAGARTAIPPFLPTSLANTRVKIKDSAGVERLAQLYSVSSDRITHVIPAQTSPGVALITVTNGGNVVAQGVASIAQTAPGLFSADLSGQGFAAALVLRIRPDGSRVFEPVARFDFEQNRFVAVPIDLSNEAEQVFLLLSGTGVRNHSGLANVRAKIGSENAEVTFAGAEGILPGVDQVNLRLQPSLRGRGEVSIELSVDGRAANIVRIKIK